MLWAVMNGIRVRQSLATERPPPCLHQCDFIWRIAAFWLNCGVMENEDVRFLLERYCFISRNGECRGPSVTLDFQREEVGSRVVEVIIEENRIKVGIKTLEWLVDVDVKKDGR